MKSFLFRYPRNEERQKLFPLSLPEWWIHLNSGPLASTWKPDLVYFSILQVILYLFTSSSPSSSSSAECLNRVAKSSSLCWCELDLFRQMSFELEVAMTWDVNLATGETLLLLYCFFKSKIWKMRIYNFFNVMALGGLYSLIYITTHSP